MNRSVLITSLSLVAAVVMLAGASLPAAQADILASGNTFLDANGELDATDNWVVIETDQISQDMIDSFVAGTDSPAFDSTSHLTFLYQLANNGGGSDDVDTLRQAYGNTSSGGYFAGWGFTDAGTAIGINENMGLDTWPDGGGDMRHGGTPGFVSNPGAYVNPSSTTITVDFIDWFFNPVLEDESGVSAILVSTANSDWVPMSESIHEPGCTWIPDGFSNPHTPEPATMSLLGLGLAALIARKRKA